MDPRQAVGVPNQVIAAIKRVAVAVSYRPALGELDDAAAKHRASDCGRLKHGKDRRRRRRRRRRKRTGDEETGRQERLVGRLQVPVAATSRSITHLWLVDSAVGN